MKEQPTAEFIFRTPVWMWTMALVKGGGAIPGLGGGGVDPNETEHR